jgi:hypothetical protein
MPVSVISLLSRAAIFLGVASIGFAQAPARREFPPGSLKALQELPASKLRGQLDRLPPAARERALASLKNFHFTDKDLDSMEADAQGGIYYADTFEPKLEDIAVAADEPVVAEAGVPVSPFPAGLIFHSKPGSVNIIYINFSGETVVGTAWNTTVGRTSIPAVAFSKDSDYSTFSDSEQLAIKRIWQRMAEDYAPFDVDVTTERPATFTTRTAHALITRNTDANGADNPSASGGGIAYINMFAASGYATYRPAWIYFNNLSNDESYIAEAASHEIGHNMGLSHDGTSTDSYYGGHGSGSTSWGPIMGTGYDRNVSQWSKGEYYAANNTQDDLATIAGKLSYRTDDHGNTNATATPLVISGTNIVSTTPETDPALTNTVNKGILERNNDVDVFSFETGGAVKLTVNPWIGPSGTRGGNLDVLLELRSTNGDVLATNNPAADTFATIQTSVAPGTYFLYVRNTGSGNPTNSSPSGYTSYGSIGEYFISGYISSPTALASVRLTVSVNDAAWGSVSTTGGNLTAGTVVPITAIAAPYYRFTGWSGGITGTNNPLTLTLSTNVTLQATFAELLGLAHSTPYTWLVAQGYTNNLATVELTNGANGLPLWQSYIAGLNPNDPASTLKVAVERGTSGRPVLRWNTATGRLYTLFQSTNVLNGFAPISGASNLPASTTAWTNGVSTSPTTFYRLAVQMQ